MKIRVRSKGTNDDWTEDTIVVESKETAQAEIDKIFAIQRDKDGNQTNADMIKVEILK